MKLIYDVYNRTLPSRIYLARPGKRLLGQLNGIQEDTASCTINLNNTSTLEFTVDRFIDGEESNYYNLIGQHYELYLERIGWFKINQEPEISFDGDIETTTVSAESLEIELQQYDVFGWRINCATEDSNEMMAKDNLYTTVDGYMLPREPVKFYRNLAPYELAIAEFETIPSPTSTDFALLVDKYPSLLSSPRITKNGRVVTVDLSENIDSGEPYYTLLDVLERELDRQKHLSLLWLVLNETGWEPGLIDLSVSEDFPVSLPNEIGKFEVENQDKYSLLTQEIANYFHCIFIFDTMNMKVNAFRVDQLGDDTNIFLSFHNIQNDITKSGDRKIYTVYRVEGYENLSITEANFGDNTVEDISYFLTPEHFAQEFIDKYTYWQSYRNEQRQAYIALSKQYRNQSDIVSELYLRVPVDISDTTQYSSLEDDELINDKNNVLAQIAGYEALYVDEEGNFDINALMQSSDWKTYKMLRDIVVPNIDIELNNRTLPSKDDYTDFFDGYLYDFDTYGDSYGVQELKAQQKSLNDRIERLKENGYDEPGDSADEYHKRNYDNYVKYSNAYSSCTRALAERQSEYDEANAELETVKGNLSSIREDVNIQNQKFNFSAKELELLNKYYIYTDYINENILITEASTNDEIVDQEYKLYKDALEQLYADAHPQLIYSCSYDNLLAMPEFKDWHGELDVGNFVRVGIRDDYQEKLRVSAITFNPFMIDTTIGIEFTTMIRYRAKRNDFASMLDSSVQNTKNQIIATLYNRSNDNYSYQIDANLVRQLLKNNTFNSYMSGMVNEGIISGGGVIIDMIDGKVTAKEISVDKITGQTGQFEEFFTRYLESDLIVTKTLEASSASINSLASELITSDRVVTGILNASKAQIEELQTKLVVAAEIDVDTLKATLAQVDTLDANSAFVHYLQSVSSTTATSVINDAYIYNAVAGKITVSDLAAGNIVLSDTMNIISENGGMIMNGNALQIYGKDKDGYDYVGIQLGYDTSSNPSLIVRDENGSVIITPNGITENAVSDNLIQTRMINNASITKEKMGFEVLEPNEYGGIDLTKVYDGSGNQFGAEYTSFKQNTTDSLNEINSKKMYRVVIESDNGNIFKNNEVNCTLSCKVYSWDEDITDEINAANFVWRRKSKDTQGDTQWNTNHSGGTKSITITSSDVYGRSVFYCDVTLPDGQIVTSD